MIFLVIYLLVTNLFEDQTDRFENPIFTRDLIQKGIDLRENQKFCLGHIKTKLPILHQIKNLWLNHFV